MQRTNNHHTPADTPRRIRCQPLKIDANRHGSGLNRREDLATARDAVSEATGAHKQCKNVDDRQVPDRPMIRCNCPRPQSNQLAADNATPEEMGRLKKWVGSPDAGPSLTSCARISGGESEDFVARTANSHARKRWPRKPRATAAPHSQKEPAFRPSTSHNGMKGVSP